MKVTEETQSGRQYRLRGKGVKGVRSGVTGDLFCQVAVETPVKLNQKQKEHLREFDEMLKKDGKSHSPRAATWFDAVKRFFKDR